MILVGGITRSGLSLTMHQGAVYVPPELRHAPNLADIILFSEKPEERKDAVQ